MSHRRAGVGEFSFRRMLTRQRARNTLLLLVVCIVSLLPPCSLADMQSDLLNSINLYRSTQGLPALAEEAGYKCVAQRYAETYSFPPCNVFTGPFPVELSNSANEASWKTACNASSGTGCRDEVCGICTGGVSSLVLMAAVPTYLTSSSLCGGASKDLESREVGLGSTEDWLVLVVQPADCTSSPNSRPDSNSTNAQFNAAVSRGSSLAVLASSIAGAAFLLFSN